MLHLIKLHLMLTVIILVTINLSQGIKDVMLTKLNLNPPKGKYKIEATINDKVNKETYKTIEYVNCLNSMSSYGKLIVNNNQTTINLYHNQLDDSKRLIVTQYNYCFFMDRKLVSLIVDAGNLLNSILIAGPSLIFRLQDQSLNWALDGNLTTIKRLTATTDDNKLNISTIYFQQSVNQSDSDLIIPNEIILSGTINGPEYGLTNLPSDELIVIDSISLTKLDPLRYHDVEFKPPLGLGCPSLIENVKLFPQMINSQQLSYHSIETSSKPNEDSKTSMIEIYSDSSKIVTIKANITNGNVNYNQSICTVSTINSDDFTNQIGQLIWLKSDFKFKGQFPSQLNGDLDTWESTNYEETINGIKYDKVITIQQLMKVNLANPSNEIPINSTRLIYNETYLGQFNLIERLTRKVLKFDSITTINLTTMEQLTTNCKQIDVN